MAARWRSRFPAAGAEIRAAADYAGYYDTLRRRLYESLTYPAVARRRSLTGTVHARRRDRCRPARSGA